LAVPARRSVKTIKPATGVIVEFSVVPLGTGSTSMKEWVLEAIKSVKGSGVRYQVSPMGTAIEAESLERAFEIIKAAHEAVLAKGASRVLTTIRIDERRDKKETLDERTGMDA